MPSHLTYKYIDVSLGEHLADLLRDQMLQIEFQVLLSTIICGKKIRKNCLRYDI